MYTNAKLMRSGLVMVSFMGRFYGLVLSGLLGAQIFG